MFKLRAHCDSLEDKALGDLSKDEVLEQARRDRNEAMEL